MDEWTLAFLELQVGANKKSWVGGWVVSGRPYLMYSPGPGLCPLSLDLDLGPGLGPELDKNILITHIMKIIFIFGFNFNSVCPRVG